MKCFLAPATKCIIPNIKQCPVPELASVNSQSYKVLTWKLPFVMIWKTTEESLYELELQILCLSKQRSNLTTFIFLLSKYRQGVMALSQLGVFLQFKRWLMRCCLHLKVEKLSLMYTVSLTNWWLRLLMKIIKTVKVHRVQIQKKGYFSPTPPIYL